KRRWCGSSAASPKLTRWSIFASRSGTSASGKHCSNSGPCTDRNDSLAATHLHLAGSGERGTERVLRHGSTIQRLDPTSHGIEYDEHYAQYKDAHQDRIQVAGKYLTG